MLENALQIIMGILISFLAGRFVRLNKEKEAIQAGLQALLRDRLTHIARNCFTAGHTDRLTKINWEAMYQSYHGLGKNGVMDETRVKMMKLPEVEEK